MPYIRTTGPIYVPCSVAIYSFFCLSRNWVHGCYYCSFKARLGQWSRVGDNHSAELASVKQNVPTTRLHLWGCAWLLILRNLFINVQLIRQFCTSYSSMYSLIRKFCMTYLSL